MILIRSKQLENGFWGLYTPYNTKFVDACRLVPGMSWDKDLRCWKGYADAFLLVEAALKNQTFAKVVGPKPSVDALSVQLPELDRYRDYQQIGIKFIQQFAKEGVLLADGTGLGKTVQTLVAAQSFGFPMVIVCPNGAKRVWADEAKKWLGLETTILSGTKPVDDAVISPEDGIVIINYDIVHAWVEVLSGAKTVAFDEAHALMNATSRRSKACKAIAHSAKNRIALTATPLNGKPKELWNIVDTISPGRFGKFFNFAQRYCNAFQEDIKVKNGEVKKIWNLNGSSHEDELIERKKFFMLRRTKADVKLQLPPKTRQIIELDIGTTVETPWNLSDDRAVRRATNIAAHHKLEAAIELALERVGEGSSVVMFAHERAIVKELRDLFVDKGVEVQTITGDDSLKKREESLSFAKNNNPSILICTTHTMGQSIDLSHADIGIIVELDYSPRWLIQLEGRFGRQEGDHKHILLYYLVALNTIDDLIRRAIVSKLDVYEKLIGSTGDFIRNDIAGNDVNALDDLRDMLIKMGEGEN